MRKIFFLILLNIVILTGCKKSGPNNSNNTTNPTDTTTQPNPNPNPNPVDTTHNTDTPALDFINGIVITTTSTNSTITLYNADLSVKWAHSFTAFGYVTGYYQGRLFVAEGGNTLHALDANTGNTLWSKPFTDNMAGTVYKADSMYTIMHNTVNSYMVARSVINGNVYWQTPLITSPYGCSPHVIDGNIISGLYVASNTAYYIFGFDIITRQIIWSTPCGGGVGSETPEVRNGTNYFLFSSSMGLTALNKAAGTIAWNAPIISGHYYSMPTLNNDTLLSISNYSLNAYSGQSGSLIWDSPLATTQGHNPFVYGRKIFAMGSSGNTDGIFAINPTNGNVIYKNDSLNMILNRPIVVENKVFTYKPAAANGTPVDRIMVLDANSFHVIDSISGPSIWLDGVITTNNVWVRPE